MANDKQEVNQQDEHFCDSPPHCHNGLCRASGSCRLPHLRAEEEAVEMLLAGVSGNGGNINRQVLGDLVRSAFRGGLAASGGSEEITATCPCCKATLTIHLENGVPAFVAGKRGKHD